MEFKDIIDLAAKYGTTPVLVILAWRMWPTIEGWIRSKSGRQQARNRRTNDNIPDRINGNPCAMHQGLLDTLKDMKGDIHDTKQSIEAISTDLFGRVGNVEKDVSWIRGKLDRD